MLAVLSIYLTAVLLCLGAGLAVRANAEPAGRWLDPVCLPLGLCTLLVLLYALAWVVPMAVGGPVAAALVAAALAVAVARRRRRPGPRAPLSAALRPTGGEVVVGAIGLVGGLLLLAPLLDLGFPTTIAISNNDGWGYASLIEWFVDHRLTWSVRPDVEEPLTFPPWSSLSNGFGIGFELLGAAVAGLLRREGFEVVNTVAAVGVPVAVGGWAALWRVLGGRLSARSALVVLGVASPLFVLPFAENYTTQFLSIAVWPFATAGFLAFARRPGPRTLALAALGTAGVIGIYPALVPWLLPAVFVAAVMPGERLERPLPRLGHLDAAGVSGRLVRAVALLAALAVTVAVIAPIQVVRGTRNLLFVGEGLGNPLFPSLGGRGSAVFGLGAQSPFAFLGGIPVPPADLAVAAIVLLVLGLAVAMSLRAGPPRWGLAAAGAVPALVTVALVANYQYLDPYPYGSFKSLISGGALLAGVLLLALASSGTRRSMPLVVGGAAACVAIWLPVSAQLLDNVADADAGFRREDVALGRALRDLPTRSTVLVEGAAEAPGSFQMRMMGAYMGSGYAGLHMEGLGSTGSYLTPGGLPGWRPDAPWSHVLTNAASAFDGGRRPEWDNGSYALASAPPIDATPYGRGWYPTEITGEAPFAWTSGPAEIVVSNRSASPRLVLRLRAASHEVPRRLTLTSGRRSATSTISPSRLTGVTFPLVVAPGATAVVELDAAPAATPAPPGDLRLLMARVQSVSVDAAPAGAG